MQNNTTEKSNSASPAPSAGAPLEASQSQGDHAQNDHRQHKKNYSYSSYGSPQYVNYYQQSYQSGMVPPYGYAPQPYTPQGYYGGQYGKNFSPNKSYTPLNAKPAEPAAKKPEAKPVVSDEKRKGIENFKAMIAAKAAAAKAKTETKSEAPKEVEKNEPEKVEKTEETVQSEQKEKSEEEVKPEKTEKAEHSEEEKAKLREMVKEKFLQARKERSVEVLEPKPEIQSEVESKEEPMANEKELEKVNEPEVVSIDEQPEEKTQEEPKNLSISETKEPVQVSESIPAGELEQPVEEKPVEEGEQLEKAEQEKVETTAGEPENAETEEAELEEPKEPSAEESIQETPQETPEATPAAPGTSMTTLFETIKNAKPIDAFSYNYPANFHGPDPKLQNANKPRYDPVFLLQFQQPLEVERDAEWHDAFSKTVFIPERKGGDRSFSKGKMPMKSNQLLGSRSGSRQNSKRKPQRGKDTPRRSGRRDRDDERAEEPLTPSEPAPKLEKSASRWVPRSQRTQPKEVKTAEDGTVLLDEDDVKSQVKSHLNKLTLEKFDTISQDIIDIALQSKHESDGKTLKQVVEYTFAKACDEPHWSSMYARFCAKMCKEMSMEVRDEENLDKEGKPVCGGALVRKYLLTRCQLEYMKGWHDKLPTNEDGTPLEPEMMSDEYYKAAAAKRRGLGLLRFIGELYILNLLSDSVIMTCLLGQSENTTDPSEDTVENLVQLVTTTGPILEGSSNMNAKRVLEVVFDRVKTIVTNDNLPSRIRFMLMDLLDLRKSRWRNSKTAKGPKTIQEIHDEAERKRIDDEREAASRRQQSRRGGDSRQNSSRGGSQWGSRISNKDLSSVGVVRNMSERGGPFTRSRPVRTPSQRAAPESSPDQSQRSESSTSNIFAALAGEDDHDSD